MNNIKKQKYESLIAEMITEKIHRDVYDDLLKQAVVQYVKLSNDKSVAKIYLTCYDETILDQVVAKANYAKGLFRKHLADNLSFRKAPQVIFFKDPVLDRTKALEQAMANLSASDQNEETEQAKAPTKAKELD